MNEIYLGIDVGTSGCKAVAIDLHGRTVAQSAVRYDNSLVNVELGSYDQSADVLLDASIACVQGVVDNAGAGYYHVAAIGFTGQMHGLVALDERLRPLRPIISCVDFRNFRQNAEIDALFGGEEGLLPFTNNRMIPSCTGGKLLWMKQNEPALYQRIRVVVNPKDYIRTAFCDIPATDESDASGFGLYDVKNRCWSRTVLERLNIPESILPPVYPSGAMVGVVTPDMAARLHLNGEVPVVAGAGDAIMQTVSSGAVTKGVYGIILGSGGLISASLPTCAVNEGAKLQIYCSALAGQWVAYAGLMSVGTSVNWFRERFYQAPDCADGGEAFDRMEGDAAMVPPGCDGLLFFPALLGQRNPVNDPFAKGVVVGLTPSHTKAHLYRAMLEGLAFGMRDVSEPIRTICAPVEELRISGGGAASRVWCQIFADIFQVPVRRVKGFAACGALGAATLALGARNPNRRLEDLFGLTSVDAEFIPDPEQKIVYDTLYSIYRKLYPATAPLFIDLKRYEEMRCVK